MLPTVRNILYSTDLSDNSRHAFQYAAYVGTQTGARIHVLHVAEPLSPDTLITLQAHLVNADDYTHIMQNRVDRLKQELTTRLDAYIDSLDETEQDIREQIASVEVCEGHPVEEILKRAARLDVDMIVMGKHQKGLLHTMVGSVSKGVLSQARVPVVVVPLPDA
jgi:nucleotide-binding universal stress UspA family protein